MEPILTVKNLVKEYRNKLAVNDINFSVNPGEIFALIGPNGAGKSTTLKIIATILSPTSGNILIKNKSIFTDAEETRAYISYLPEEAGAYKNMRGLDYLDFMASLYFTDKKRKDKAVNLAINITDLGDVLNQRINTYSKGMTRKLLLARTVMTEPYLAILDEPTSGLDVVNAFEIRNTIKNMSKNGNMSVLLSSHNMLEIEYLSDRVAIIDRGVIHALGAPEELKQQFSAKNLEEVFVRVANRNRS